jgi:hypothetical protein
MLGHRSIWHVAALAFFLALAGCGTNAQYGGSPGQGGSGNSSVVLEMTDTPPSNVTILSARVTLTGATLNPGNVSLFSGSATVDLVKLQTEIAYLATAANIPAGNYTGVTLTFANPSLTIENDTTTPIISGSITCSVGAICTIPPTATANLSTTVPLTSFTIASSGTAGLLIDVNLDTLLSATMGADFSAGTTVTPFTPGGFGAPAVGAEDVVGQVANLNTTNKTFSLSNVTGTYALKVDNTSTFFAFPNTTACPSVTPGIACLQNNQILSVDIGIQADGSLLARNIVLEDADNSDTEVEGIITSTNAGAQQFNMVIQAMSAPASGFGIGQAITVQYSSMPQTPFDVDVVHADNLQVTTSGFLFAAPADLVVGQQVSIRRNSTLSAGVLKADRVRLRSTRVTATVQLGLPNMLLANLPSLFSGHGGVTTITAQTSLTPPTIYFEIGKSINSSNVVIGEVVSTRGPLFNVSGSRTMITTKVVVKP